MFFSPWRRMRSSSGPSRASRSLGARTISFRPQLDPLEDRLLPAPGPGGALGLSAGGLTSGIFATLQVMTAAAPATVTGTDQTGGKTIGFPNPMKVTVAENAAATVIPLGAIFAAMTDIHAKDGLMLSILGNTSPGLVKTDLSGADLTLTYARGKCGTATITVGATDVDGVSVRQTILVTVGPAHPAVTGGPATVPAPRLAA
jgi:hypothetical protein